MGDEQRLAVVGMKAGRFAARLADLQTAKGTDWALLLQPRLLDMPLPIQRYDDPFLPFGKAMIAGTRDVICAYVFDFAAYLALGAAGAVALERTLAYVSGGGDALTILHAPFVGGAYAAAVGETGFNADAVTVTTFADAAPYLDAVGGAFVVSSALTTTPDQWGGAGVYLPSKQLMLLPNGARLRVLGDEVVYAGRGDDFAEQARGAIMRLADGG